MIYIDEDARKLVVEDAVNMVSEQRHEKALRFVRHSDQQLSLSAYLLLLRGLREEYGVSQPPVFSFNENGKPFIDNMPDVHFSLSHSKYVTACAIDDSPIGIDIEIIRPVDHDLMEYTMNDDELRIILASDDKNVAFFRYWTQKEAILKLTGEGISNEMKYVLNKSDNFNIETTVSDKYVYSVARYK